MGSTVPAAPSIPPVLETERLILRPLTMDDATEIFEMVSDPEMTRYVGWEHHRTIEDSVVFLRDTINGYRRGEPWYWGLGRKDERRLVGVLDLFAWTPEHQRAEVGYWTGKGYWGLGFTAEALTRVIAYGFTELGLHRIQAHCDVLNAAASRVMEKAGKRLEGIVREHMLLRGRYRDSKLQSILRSEWEA